MQRRILTKVFFIFLAGLTVMVVYGQGSQQDAITSSYAQRQQRMNDMNKSFSDALGLPAQPGASTAQARAGGAPSRSLSYIQWRDPAEGAFTVSLPRGWQISGGTQRPSQLEPHYVIHAQSPSGGVSMFMDDPRLLMRQLPSQFYPREGQVISAPAGSHLLIQNYRPAPQAAQEYILKSVCPSATQFRGGLIRDQTQDLGYKFNLIARASGMQMRVDVGEQAFKCNDRVGYVYAITSQVVKPGGMVSIWFFYRIGGYLATSAESAQAAAAVQTMLTSFQMDQQWLERFAQESNDTARTVIAASNAITQSTIARAQQQDADEKARFAAWKKSNDETFNAGQKRERERMDTEGNGHDYNPQLNTKKVCDDMGHCDYWADANVTNWWFDCAGKDHPGSETGDPPPSSQSNCWHKGH
jgi:hypothetical protein